VSIFFRHCMGDGADLEVDFATIHWEDRECRKLGCDQLIEKNPKLAALHREVTARHTGPTVDFEGPFDDAGVRFHIALQIQAYFENAAEFAMSGVVSRRIDASDPRRGLRGQWGLFCSPDGPALPEGYVVGPYSGQVYTREQYYERYSSLPARLEHERYSMGLDYQPGPDPLMIDAMEHGCEVILINDCRLEPFGSDQIYKPANCCYLQVRYLGWPHVFVVTTAPLQPGAELLVDYGTEYWQAHHTLHAEISGMIAALQPFVAMLLGQHPDGDEDDDDDDEDEEGEEEEDDDADGWPEDGYDYTTATHPPPGWAEGMDPDPGTPMSVLGPDTATHPEDTVRW